LAAKLTLFTFFFRQQLVHLLISFEPQSGPLTFTGRNMDGFQCLGRNLDSAENTYVDVRLAAPPAIGYDNSRGMEVNRTLLI